MRPSLICIAALSTGCAISESRFDQKLSASGVDLVLVSVERGDFDYQGNNTQTFAIDGRSWGMAFQEETAHERQDGNASDVHTEGNTLLVSATSTSGSSGVDFYVEGPDTLSTDITLDHGDVSLANMAGYQLITADSVDLDNMVGSVDAYARSGSIDASISPGPGDVIRLEAMDGGIDLALPYGLPYDLQVWGDPEYPMAIEDLGFSNMVASDAYYAARSGNGSVRVDVYASGGEVRIHHYYY